MILFRYIKGFCQATILLVPVIAPAQGLALIPHPIHADLRAALAAKVKPAPQPPPKNEPTPPAAAPIVAAPPQPDALGRSTPYGCVIGFLQAAGNNSLSLATSYLDTKLPDKQAEDLAKQLKAVLDASLSSNINRLSKEEQGDIHDGLNINREKIGVAKTADGDLDIYLDRVQHKDEPPVWLFASETLTQIPGIYSHMQTHDPADWLPESVRKIKFFGQPAYRWISIILSLGLAVLLSTLVARLILWVLRQFLMRGQIADENNILKKLKHPTRLLLLSVAVWYCGTLALSVYARHYWGIFAQLFFVIGLSWLFASIIDIAAGTAIRRSLMAGTQPKIAIITLVQRLTKILIAFVIFIAFLRGVGINVSAMVAGLGIGGVALALAAQSTLQDLFGGISIIMRDTIRVGDHCRVADVTGTIEDIGLSSTRLRTLDRTVISIPNSKIAQVSSENFALRDKFWFHHLFSLRAYTSVDQVNGVLANIKALMDAEPDFEADSRVNLLGFQEAACRIEVFAYIQASSYNDFLTRQQEMLLKISTAIAEAGTQLAMATQVSYVESVDRMSRQLSTPKQDEP
jgi:MscS family membrane protein